MKTFMKKVMFLSLMLALTFTLAACTSKNKYYFYPNNLVSAFTSENYVDFWVWGENDKTKYEDLVTEMNNELLSLDNKFNIQDRGDGVVTDLMKVNNNSGIAPVKVDQEVIKVIKLAIEVSEETLIDGKAVYDVTISPVWKLWDFPNKTYSFIMDNRNEPPLQTDIDDVLPLVDYKKIEINEEESTVYLPVAGMGIDLGSIVKGYAADKMRDILVKYGITKAVINIGRNILLLGSSYDKDNDYQDKPFDVKIVTPYVSEFDPEEVRTFGYLKVTDETIVTSGTYEKYIKDTNGDEYHHILDPRTGFPFDNGVVSISVITKESIKGDAYSTALFSLGLEKGMELVNSIDGLETVWVVKNGYKYDVYISSGLEGNFEFNQNVEGLDYVYKGVYK